MNYSIYISNGQIVRIVSTNNIQQQLSAGESFINGVYQDDKYYIENSVAIEIPENTDDSLYFNYDLKKWVPKYTPEQQYQMAVEAANQKRNALLYKSDWTQIPGNPLTPEKQQEWAIYRQELRDITSQPGYPYNVIWPIQPE